MLRPRSGKIIKNEFCQACGKQIEWKEQVIAVRYGTIHVTAHPHTRVEKEREDFFHRKCAGLVAITDSVI